MPTEPSAPGQADGSGGSVPAAAVAPPFSHSDAFRLRRFLNWFPLGLAYAFLYMGRYNLTVAKTALGEVMTKEDFGVIFGAGALTYGLAFLLNGPLTDRIGGKLAMLISVFGAAAMNLVMGFYVAGLTSAGGDTSGVRLTLAILYAGNMYFQSFGAVAIVKVNSAWFHVRERGGFSGIFGTMISSGIFFAFTVNGWLLDLVTAGGGSKAQSAKWVFFLPALLLAGIALVELFLLRDRPSQAGLVDFDTGDASSGEDAGRIPTGELFRRILTHPVILTIACIEFCTGLLRQGVMHWYPIYSREVLALPGTHPMVNGSWSRWQLMVGCFVIAAIFLVLARRATGGRKAWLSISGGLIFLTPFCSAGWGGLLMVAGVIGSNVAGWVSDVFFQSRRAPASGGLYFVLFLASVAMIFILGDTTLQVDWVKAGKGAPPAATETLMPGDRVVSVDGKADLQRWSDVQKAFACVPASCTDGARFDVQKCTCTMKPKAPLAGPAHQGPIVVQVLRAGEKVDLRLPDIGPKMRAGDRRTLSAGPVTTLNPYVLGLVVLLMSLCVIGTHGLLSGTATMDFGGRKAAATAVGVIDGFVYLGTALQGFALGYLTPRGWGYWPIFLCPFALVGFLLTLRIWNARPGKGGGGH